MGWRVKLACGTKSPKPMRSRVRSSEGLEAVYHSQQHVWPRVMPAHACMHACCASAGRVPHEAAQAATAMSTTMTGQPRP